MYLTPTSYHWACDIEADGLLEEATRIWCACLINVVTKEKATCLTEDDFRGFQEKNPEAIYVGHNFLAYDAVMLNRFWKAGIPVSRIVDTFVLSQVFNPSYAKPKGLKGKKGPHSLEAWGVRLRYPKTEHEDFSKLTPEMLTYCMRDTVLTALLFRKLTERMRQSGFSERGIEIEHLAWNIIQNKQRRTGFPFNRQAAEELYGEIRTRVEQLEAEIYKLWPPEFRVVKHFKQCRKCDGNYTQNYIRHKEQYPELRETLDGGYDAYDTVTFNIGSPQQRITKLLELGWVPTQKTKAGNPKVDEEALLEFADVSGNPEIKAIAKWLVSNSRAKMLNNWLAAYNDKTDCLHGKLFINSTLRYKHSDPNSANIPAVKTEKDENGVEHVLYGEKGTWAYECRDLYTCGDPDEFSLVGIDGTGIQNRCLIHGLIKTVGEERVRDFKELALEGDIHRHNIEVLGLANKPAAKKFYYTLMMGGRGGRLAADQAQFGTKMTAKEGEAKRRQMIASIPGFNELIKALEKELEKTGRIVLCDGTPILVPSPHMVIPYLLQGDESRLMKQSLIYVDRNIKLRRLTKHVFKVADIHDEWQWKVRNAVVQEFIDLALPCFLEAGRSFDYLIPIEGDAKVGKTWAQTH